MENISPYLDNITIISFIAVYIAGVATSFTPCIYPLIPVIAGVIGVSAEQSKIRNFALSICYVLGMALTFAVLGVIAALTGKLFGEIQANPVAHVVVGGVIILFGLAFLEVIPLPPLLLGKGVSVRAVKGGSAISVLFMGAASGFVMAPCMTAVNGALLAYVASTQDVVLGFLLLFIFTVGRGTVLILVGTFSGMITAMPRSAKWVAIVAKVMALMLVALGCYFIFKAGVLSV